ncbi:hypothetical protein PILCRDRAFT_505564 [Piloderma croceum F 1598]|uniref:Uncharacterized protein n=1 Tax=Piloderma croceum (strain F 1598) TaxID=765440 RepID=A0A0C3BV74_PILCF|nr:hypothetical protein PILCRDRAFT_505564 [Piloderma croceum F 1598]
MAGFLRKKSKPDPKLKQSTPSPVDNNNSYYANGGSPSSNSPTVVPPLYARFATTNASVVKQDSPLPSPPTTTMPSSGTRPVVSGPMSLASASSRRVNHVPSRVMTNGSNNGSAVDVRSQRLGMVNGSASGSGFFAGAGASSPYSNTTPNASQFNFQASRQNSSISNSNANAYTYGSQGNGPGTTSRVSLDKPLPSPVGAGFVGVDSPMGHERRVSVDKPLPVPISQQQQYVPSSRNWQQQQQPNPESSYPDIRRKDTATTNNTRYPNDLTQHLSSVTKAGGGDKQLPSQPPPQSQVPLSSNINMHSYGNGYNTPRQQHTYPPPPDPSQLYQFSTPRTPPPVPLPTRTSPPTSSNTNYPNPNPNIIQAPKPPSPTKKSQFPSLTRLSLSRSKSPPKPPSPTKPPPPSSTKRTAPTKLLRSRSNTSSGLAASPSISKSLISRPSLSRVGGGVGNDPGYGEGERRGGASFDSVNKSGYVPSTTPSHSSTTSVSSRSKRIASQSTGHTHSKRQHSSQEYEPPTDDVW